MQGKLIFETDWDFSIEYKGKIYTEYDFEIYIESAQDFDKINFLGPWGSGPASGKFSEVEEMLEKIEQDLKEARCFLGGNRGVEWIPYTTEAEDIAHRAEKIAQELRLLPREVVLKMFGEVIDTN